MKKVLATLIFAIMVGLLVLGGCGPASIVPEGFPSVTPTITQLPLVTPSQVVGKESEPNVSISPTSGPAGTLVRVAASGFRPITPVSVELGPENSGFTAVVQGVTDADGVFIVHVPADGVPGMNLIFVVTAEGQRGVTSPDQFKITNDVLNSVITPTLTPNMDIWTTYSNSKLAISMEYPAEWQPVPGYGSPEMGETRYAAVNGFFHVGAMDTDSIDQAAAAEAGHKLMPYGSQPTIETLQIQGQEARLIMPSDDQPAGMQHQAAMIIRYPQPVNVLGTPCRFFVLYADYSHIRTFGETLRFTN